MVTVPRTSGIGGFIAAFRLAAAALVLAAPSVALACPQCAGRADGGVAQGVLLGAFILLPFAVVGVVFRFIRSESSGERAHSRLGP